MMNYTISIMICQPFIPLITIKVNSDIKRCFSLSYFNSGEDAFVVDIT